MPGSAIDDAALAAGPSLIRCIVIQAEGNTNTQLALTIHTQYSLARVKSFSARPTESSDIRQIRKRRARSPGPLGKLNCQ